MDKGPTKSSRPKGAAVRTRRFLRDLCVKIESSSKTDLAGITVRLRHEASLVYRPSALAMNTGLPGIADFPRARGGMADAPDLGSGSERIRGSSPLARTTFAVTLL
jgi:hypothetical protein